MTTPQGLVKVIQMASTATPRFLSTSPFVIARHVHRGAIVQAVKRCPLSTMPRRQFEPTMPLVHGLDPVHREDLLRSISAIEKVLDDLKVTQERQRRLFREQAGHLVPSLSSPQMQILFEEAGLQQSTIIKNINNMKENLLSAEKESMGHSFNQ